ncbi:pyridoxamine 5'-phosphate oxidase [Emticicia sp. CRIBPO]|uniref:pyridoxamine 5'-phosphate oxidase n=1 Tax=Emticicia sp. CRIBPO TaxID=2683258 RepID=UPI0014123017|nr:pyridoxamine 5'-phosphate oxidase [Emticicia sp. CRIBPO]NBA84682.1 pyridoxamine 5'-phosphate oxidase [Emticicia sp. CRIBPO]
MNKASVADLRINYVTNELLEKNVFNDPVRQFEIWFKDAKDSGIREPNAMVLSTIEDNKPSSRVVLLKGFDSEGFVFYTNYLSDKGIQMAETPFVSLNFFWDILERQVRVEGTVEKVSEKDSDEYYWSRPRGSQIGAWVSNQSSVVETREVLQEKLDYFEAKFKDMEVIPRPPHWGGYLVRPEKIEFWQGRPNRLHDRLLFSHDGAAWKIERLSP